MTNFADMVGPCICVWCNSPDVKVNCKRIWYCPLWSARGFKTFCYLKLSCSCHWMHIKQCIALSYGKKKQIVQKRNIYPKFHFVFDKKQVLLRHGCAPKNEDSHWKSSLVTFTITNYLIACGHFFTSSIVATFFCFVLLC